MILIAGTPKFVYRQEHYEEKHLPFITEWDKPYGAGSE
jgi:hypothetical protein